MPTSMPTSIPAYIPLQFPLAVRHMHADSTAISSANIRQKNAYFQVDEVLGFEPAGEGEHLFVHVRKDGQNSIWVKEQIAQQLGISPRDIGHAGLKDRHALTTQWLSIYAPKTEPALEQVQIEGVEILQSSRHRQKLKPGMHAGNLFAIRLTELQAQREAIDKILNRIKALGFPNYFGEQRFGRDGSNLPKGWQLLKSRRLSKHKKKSIYLSSLRSFLFNRVLDARLALVSMNSEDQQVLDGTGADSAGAESTGPLWGRGRLSVDQQQAEFEQQTLAPWSELCEALEFSGLNQERRNLYVIPQHLQWNWLDDAELEIRFQLPPGAYATSLLRELAEIVDLGQSKTELADTERQLDH